MATSAPIVSGVTDDTEGNGVAVEVEIEADLNDGVPCEGALRHDGGARRARMTLDDYKRMRLVSAQRSVAKAARVEAQRRDWKKRRAVLVYAPKWPVCRYHPLSKRNGPRRQYERDLDALDGWNRLRCISIDGMNGTGKSTLAASMNRWCLKINNHCPYVTKGARYNYSPLRSVEYVMHHALYDTGDAYVVWDRCRYSNLIFAYIHYLMSVFEGRPMGNENEVILFLNNMALATGLFATVGYVESLCVDQPILFLVCRDLGLVAQSLLARGGANDAYNAKETNYQTAQYHVYRYFARLLNAPLIDLATRPAGETLSDLHRAIRSRVDRPSRSPGLPPPPSDDSSASLHAFCDRHDDTMVYTCSTK